MGQRSCWNIASMERATLTLISASKASECIPFSKLLTTCSISPRMWFSQCLTGTRLRPTGRHGFTPEEAMLVRNVVWPRTSERMLSVSIKVLSRAGRW